MYRLLITSLGRGLLRAAGRWRPYCSARLLPGLARGWAPEVQVPPFRVPPHGWGLGLLPPLAALAWFSRPADAEEDEQQRAGGAADDDAADEAEAEIIQLLKRAKLSIMKDEPEEAELILHDALRLAYQNNNKKAITYTYDLMANLAFIRGQLDNAEKLFKATMSYLLGGGMLQEDNAIIEISLKLASIYAAQNKQEFALAGYEFCISTLEGKIEKEKELADAVLSVEEKANTHLLLGMCLDAYAHYLLFSKQPSQAQRMYERALQISEEILGERHPRVKCQGKVEERRQAGLHKKKLIMDMKVSTACKLFTTTIVLMSDLATTLDAQGRFDEACVYVQRASDLARQTEHPELHMLLSNLAAVLMHRERYAQAKEIYQEALKQAELKRDEVSIQHIREELAELSRKSRSLT
ncbi:tetratricopeptide repeat protein 19, mitochondrial isoform X1 [Manis javanica]|uniref:tetratricopeptide repeat protein 19, mitochondrial isoform X1 n=2 Tax=Manis javanica TaxID=9974 RepID=UPI000813023E|nr:tetratricopeptide repeat protein 19, mitochondrial isoform X1 [Manis javanica]KAI5930449.1 Tetratricopeptide repeat protein 19, mitochondrial [Manis javanica]